MPKWGDLSVEEKTKIYEAVAKVYEEEGYPEGLKDPGCSGEYVNIMMAKKKEDNLSPLVIEGSFGPDQAELVDRLKTKLTEAVKGADDA